MITKKVLIISGPTATGKTDLAIEIVKNFPNVEIVNFDSLLFYKELSIGTAKPSTELLNKYPHHMVNITSAKNHINAADYLKLLSPVLDKLLNDNKIPLFVGGSGFYIRAFLYGMYPSTTTSKEILEQSNQLFSKEGIKPFIEILKQNDIDDYNLLNHNDHYRIRRSVEHFWSTGKPFGQIKKEYEQNKKILLKNFRHFYLDIPKEQHWDIIKQRTIKMLDSGLIGEVQELLSKGFSGEEKPLQSIGYKQVVNHLHHKTKKDDLLNEIYISTRQLAKSQRTFFNKLEGLARHNALTEKDKIIKEIYGFLNS